MFSHSLSLRLALSAYLIYPLCTVLRFARTLIQANQLCSLPSSFSLSFASRSYVESPGLPFLASPSACSSFTTRRLRSSRHPVLVLLSCPEETSRGPFLGGSWPDRTEIPVGGFLLFLILLLARSQPKPVLMLVIKTNLPTWFSVLRLLAATMYSSCRCRLRRPLLSSVEQVCAVK